MSETIEDELRNCKQRIAELEKRSYKLLGALVQIAEVELKGSEVLKFADWAQMLAANAVLEFEQSAPAVNKK